VCIGNYMDGIDYGTNKKKPPEIGLNQTALKQCKLFVTQMLYNYVLIYYN